MAHDGEVTMFESHRFAEGNVAGVEVHARGGQGADHDLEGFAWLATMDHADLWVGQVGGFVDAAQQSDLRAVARGDVEFDGRGAHATYFRSEEHTSEL